MTDDPRGSMLRQLTTATLVRIGAVVLAVATVFAAIAGWVALDIVEAGLELAPELQAAGEPSGDMFGAVGDTLDEVREGLVTLEEITDRVGTSTGDAADVVEEMATLSTGRLPDTLSSLEEALPSLIDTAAVIDSTMRTLSVLGVDYRPQVPLDEAFGDVHAQLDGLPESINAQGEKLGALADEIRTTGEETKVLAGQIERIQGSLSETQGTLDDYAGAMDNLGRLAAISETVEASLPIGRLALAVLALAGLVLGAVGWTLGSRQRA